MKQLQLVSITPEELTSSIFNYIDKKFEELKKLYQPKNPTKYQTRKEVADMLSVNISSVHNMSKRGVLQKYQISGKVLYKRSEVEAAIIKLKK